MKTSVTAQGLRPSMRHVLAAPAAAVLLTLAACADMSGISSQAALRSPASVGLANSAASSVAPELTADWWQAYGDPQLNALVTDALATSPSLKVAQARLTRAMSVTEVAKSATLPQVGAGIDVQRQLFTANGLYPPPLAGSVQNTGTLQLSTSWELDFFGKNRAALDAALGSAKAAEADAQAARVLLTANITRTWFQLARLNGQLTLAQRSLAQRGETLDLVRDRVSAGLDTRLELRQSEGGLPEARQQIEALQEQVALTRHALDALVGQPDRTATLALPTLAAFKPVAFADQLPADLLGRRADVAAARWRVEAATQDVAYAKTQFYPNINLTAYLGLSSIGFDRLLRGSSEQWGVGPALRLPIFDAGRLRANLRGKAADLDLAIESYNGAVIEAVHEVRDQLSSAQSITRQQAEQRAAQNAAESAYDIATQRYKAGLGNYLQVLSAETNVLAQRRLAVDLAARALDAQVGLARALGGGYAGPGATAMAATSIKNPAESAE